jgi:uncharacterized membrane protein
VVNAKLHRFVDKKRVRDAIVRAEETTSAPIAVSVVPHLEGDVHAAALRALHARGLSRTPERNAVHFFVVPSRREFAVVGDAGAHERLGQAAWDGVAATVERHFRRGDPTAGLIAGIEEIGSLLARHFPRTPPRERDAT